MKKIIYSLLFLLFFSQMGFSDARRLWGGDAYVGGAFEASSLSATDTITAATLILGASEIPINIPYADSEYENFGMLYDTTYSDIRLKELSLEYLADVDVTGLTDGMILMSSGGIWSATPYPGSDGSYEVISVTDITINSLIYEPILQDITSVNDSIDAASGTYFILTPDADYVLSSTPTISAASNGQFMVLYNTSDNYSITIQAEADLTGSQSEQEIVLGPEIMATLFYNTTESHWELASLRGTSLTVSPNSGLLNVTNNTGSIITKGKWVALSGYSTIKKLPTVALASLSTVYSYPTIGAAVNDIGVGLNGVVIHSGEISGVSTAAFNSTDPIYLSNTDGVATNIKPATVQYLGQCVYSHITKGRNYVDLSPPEQIVTADITESEVQALISAATGSLTLGEISNVSDTYRQVGWVPAWNGTIYEATPQSGSSFVTGSYLPLDGSVPMEGDIDSASYAIKNVGKIIFDVTDSVDGMVDGEVRMVAGTGITPSTTSLSFTDLADSGIVSPVSGELIQYNGTQWVNVDLVIPYIAATTYLSTPGAGAKMLYHAVPRDVTFPVNLVNSQGICEVTPTAETIFSICKNSVEFATATFAIGNGTASFSAPNQTLFEAGDILSIVAPDPADDTLANLGITLFGTQAIIQN